MLIPLLGTQRTFLLLAVMVAAVAVAGVGVRWAPVPVALAALLLLPVGTIKGDDDGRVIFEADTTHQYARVVELEQGERRLELNEGQAIHSLYRPETVLTGDVWDGYLVTPFAALTRTARRVAILGNGAGTTARAYAEYFPRTQIDGVEIDGELHDIGKRFFGLRDRPQLDLYTEDARPFLRRSDGGYDAIFVDAYRQPYIPFYLTTREFFSLVRDRLAPGGVLIVNAGHPEGSDRLEQVLSETIAAVFPNVGRDPLRAHQHADRRLRGAGVAGGARAQRVPPARPVAVARARDGEPAGPAARRRRRLHRRQGARGVAHRPVDRGVRGRWRRRELRPARRRRRGRTPVRHPRSVGGRRWACWSSWSG